MLRASGLATAVVLTAMAAHAEQVSYLHCKYESLDEDRRWKSQSIPLYYENNNLVAGGRRNHCVDEYVYNITDEYLSWRCVAAIDANNKPVRSVYIEINRFTGRYHRNDFDGHYNEGNIREIWHGVCSAHHEAQF